MWGRFLWFGRGGPVVNKGEHGGRSLSNGQQSR